MAARPFLKIVLRSLFPFSVEREAHYLDFIFPLIVLLMYGGPIIVHNTPGDSSDVRAFAVIGRQKQTVQVGDVVAQGKLVDDGTNQYCDIPTTTYGLSGASDGVASISLRVTNDCQLVVAKINTAATEPISHCLPDEASEVAHQREGVCSYVTFGATDEPLDSD